MLKSQRASSTRDSELKIYSTTEPVPVSIIKGSIRIVLEKWVKF
jgi:hypothetical protein